MEATENIHSPQPRREISTQEASEISGFTVNHIALLLRRGTIEGRRFSGRSWMVYTDSLEEYLAKPRKPGPKSKEIAKQSSDVQESSPSDVQVTRKRPSVIREERIVGGGQYGSSTETKAKGLFSLASPQARQLMDLAHIDCFAVDDCMILTNSKNFEGWASPDIKTTILSTPLPIPHDLAQLRQDKLPTIEQCYFNGTHYRLSSFTPPFSEQKRLEVRLSPLTFYEYYSLTPFFDDPLLTAPDGSKVSIRQKYGNTVFLYYHSTDPSTSLIPAPVSIQCVVVTKDQQIVLMQRSFAVAFYPEHWSASFEETMTAPEQVNDPSRSADFFASALRGSYLELAVPADKVTSIKVLSLNVEYLTLSVDAITVMEVSLTGEEIKQNWLLRARHREQASNFALLSTDLNVVVDKLFSKILWHPTSRMRLIQYLFHAYGIDEVEEAFKARVD